MAKVYDINSFESHLISRGFYGAYGMLVDCALMLFIYLIKSNKPAFAGLFDLINYSGTVTSQPTGAPAIGCESVPI
jgi:hypothetical protein